MSNENAKPGFKPCPDAVEALEDLSEWIAAMESVAEEDDPDHDSISRDDVIAEIAFRIDRAREFGFTKR